MHKTPAAASKQSDDVSCAYVQTQMRGEPYATIVFVIPSLAPPKWNGWQKWAQPHLAETCKQVRQFLVEHQRNAGMNCALPDMRAVIALLRRRILSIDLPGWVLTSRGDPGTDRWLASTSETAERDRIEAAWNRYPSEKIRKQIVAPLLSNPFLCRRGQPRRLRSHRTAVRLSKSPKI